MSIIIMNKYTFAGHFANSSSLHDRSGVYIVLGNKYTNWSVIDVGESAKIKTRIDYHDRVKCWRDQKRNQKYENLSFAALYVDANKREPIAEEIRKRFNPPCGRR